MVLACEITIDDTKGAAMVLLPLPNALYLLDDEALAEVWSGLVWCDSCHDFRAGEAIETRGYVEELLSRSLAGNLPDYHSFIFLDNAEQIEKFRSSLKRRLHWLASRKSPPRCLECGSTEIKPISSKPNGKGVDGLGRAISYSQVFASTGIDHRLFLYDTEGNLLGEISRICPVTGEFIGDGYSYRRIVEMLTQERQRDKAKR